MPPPRLVSRNSHSKVRLTRSTNNRNLLSHSSEGLANRQSCHPVSLLSKVKDQNTKSPLELVVRGHWPPPRSAFKCHITSLQNYHMGPRLSPKNVWGPHVAMTAIATSNTVEAPRKGNAGRKLGVGRPPAMLAAHCSLPSAQPTSILAA